MATDSNVNYSNNVITVAGLAQFKGKLDDLFYSRAQVQENFAKLHGDANVQFNALNLSLYNSSSQDNQKGIKLYVQDNNGDLLLKLVNVAQESNHLILPLVDGTVWTNQTFNPSGKVDANDAFIEKTIGTGLSEVSVKFDKHPQICVFQFLKAASNSELTVSLVPDSDSLSVTGASIQGRSVIYVSSSQVPSGGKAGFYLSGDIQNAATTLHYLSPVSVNSIYYNKTAAEGYSQFYYGSSGNVLTGITIAGSGGGGGGGSYTIATSEEIEGIFDEE